MKVAFLWPHLELYSPQHFVALMMHHVVGSQCRAWDLLLMSVLILSSLLVTFFFREMRLFLSPGGPSQVHLLPK